MIQQSEFMEISTAQLVFMKSLYPRDHPSIKVISKYADAMSTGANFPPIAVASVDGRYAIIDGVHRAKAINLLSGFKGQSITVEFIGNATEQEAFEEAVKRNQGHGLAFHEDDLKKIVKRFKENGKDLLYVSGILHIPELKLKFDPPERISYPGGDNGSAKKSASPLGMTLEELIGWTRKFIRKGNVNQESVDLLEKLRDEINELLRKRREEIKSEKIGVSGPNMGKKDDESENDSGLDGNSNEDAKGDVELVTDHADEVNLLEAGRIDVGREEPALDQVSDKDPPMKESQTEPKRMVDHQTLAAAIKNTFEGMSDEESRKIALHVLGFFGFEKTCLANGLEQDDNQLFYMLEDKGLLKTCSEETSMVKDGKPWRISEYELDYEKVFAAADRKNDAGTLDVYSGLPQEAWVR